MWEVDAMKQRILRVLPYVLLALFCFLAGLFIGRAIPAPMEVLPVPELLGSFPEILFS